MLPITRFSVHFLGVIWHLRRVVAAMSIWMLIGAVAIAHLEKMPLEDAVYFSFITGLTVGFGDIVVKTPFGRLVAVLIGFTGVLFTGLVVAAAVETIRKTYHHSDHSD